MEPTAVDQADEGMHPLTPSIATKAPLPVVYVAAQQALAQCVAIDECKEWADKAAALECYARQRDDETLLNLATRIKARAVRRIGELLMEIEPKHTGRPPENRGGTPPISRKKAATDAGLSDDKHKQALRIARIPEGSFNTQTDSDPPPTLVKLAEQGTRRKPIFTRDELNLMYRKLLDKTLTSAEQLRRRLLQAVQSRPVPTDATAAEVEMKIKAELESIAELGEKLPRSIFVSNVNV